MLFLLGIAVIDAAVIDVKQAPYNAVGDGNANDTTAIQNAINDNPNSEILLQNGTFKITGALNLLSTRTLAGSNATLKYSSASCGVMINCSSNVAIEGLVINGNNQATFGIEVTNGTKYVYISNCELLNFAGNSTTAANAIDIRDTCSDISIVETKIHDVDGGGNGVQGDSIGANRLIYIQGVTRMLIDHCEFYNIGPWEDGDCIQVQASGTSDVTIRSCKFYNFMKRAIKIQASGVVATNNLISCAGADDGVNAPAEGIAVMGATSGEISNNIIILNRASWAISIAASCSNVKVTGNTTDIYGYYYTGFANMPNCYYYQCRQSFIRAMFLAESSYCTFDGNTSFAYYRGLHMRNSSNNTITNNNVLTSLYPFWFDNSTNNTSTNNIDYTTTLQGFWRFNDSADINTNSTFDFPDNNYPGNPVGFTSGSIVDGVVGKALSFSGNNNFINMGDVLDMGTSSFSICAWVKSASASTGNGIVFKRGNGNNVAAGYGLDMPNGTFQFHIADGTNYQNLIAGTSGKYNDGKWHHVAAVATRGADLKIYVDGQFINSAAETNVGNINSDTCLAIGGLTLNGITCYSSFTGAIDEVMIFNKALTAAEVNKIYLKQEIK